MLRMLKDVASIVLVGNFNPAIFQPAWLAAKELIRESEATGANIEIIHPELTQFCAGWLRLSVGTTRFAASTEDPAHWGPLRDLVTGAFTLLDQTPTSALGLNRTVYVDLGDSETWHALGHLLAPKSPWEGILREPGMNAVRLQGLRADGRPGHTFVRVEPLAKYANAVFVNITNEYVPTDPATPADTNTPYFLQCIKEDWERILADAKVSVDKLVSQVLREQAR
ncbi:MAG: hypothetical protein FWD69_11880 [Polyangiaceae bacterium]|nr:hypothetical protein [Polyangiaceae bacterium]